MQTQKTKLDQLVDQRNELNVFLDLIAPFFYSKEAKLSKADIEHLDMLISVLITKQRMRLDNLARTIENFDIMKLREIIPNED